MGSEEAAKDPSNMGTLQEKKTGASLTRRAIYTDCKRCERPLTARKSRTSGYCALCNKSKKRAQPYRPGKRIPIFMLASLLSLPIRFTAADMAEKADAPITSVYRYLGSLEMHGLVERVGTKIGRGPGANQVVWKRNVRRMTTP